MNVGRRASGPSRRSIAAPVLMFSVTAGCMVDRFDGAYIYNYPATPIQVAVVLQYDGSTCPFVTIEPGPSTTYGGFRDGCAHVGLLALDPSGQVVAERDTMCAGDYWFIGTRPTGSPSPR